MRSKYIEFLRDSFVKWNHMDPNGSFTPREKAIVPYVYHHKDYGRS